MHNDIHNQDYLYIITNSQKKNPRRITEWVQPDHDKEFKRTPFFVSTLPNIHYNLWNTLSSSSHKFSIYGLFFNSRKYAVDNNESTAEPLYQCAYTHEGEFNDKNLADEDGVFRGRPAERLRFRKGDIVEVYDRDVSLGIVYGTPLSPERCSEIATPDEHGRFVILDRYDDQFTILFLASESKSESQEHNLTHDHIQSQFLFHPTKTIPPSIINRLKALVECDDWNTFILCMYIWCKTIFSYLPKSTCIKQVLFYDVAKQTS